MTRKLARVKMILISLFSSELYKRYIEICTSETPKREQLTFQNGQVWIFWTSKTITQINRSSVFRMPLIHFPDSSFSFQIRCTSFAGVLGKYRVTQKKCHPTFLLIKSKLFKIDACRLANIWKSPCVQCVASFRMMGLPV